MRVKPKINNVMPTTTSLASADSRRFSTMLTGHFTAALIGESGASRAMSVDCPKNPANASADRDRNLVASSRGSRIPTASRLKKSCMVAPAKAFLNSRLRRR